MAEDERLNRIEADAAEARTHQELYAHTKTSIPWLVSEIRRLKTECDLYRNDVKSLLGGGDK